MDDRGNGRFNNRGEDVMRLMYQQRERMEQQRVQGIRAQPDYDIRRHINNRARGRLHHRLNPDRERAFLRGVGPNLHPPRRLAPATDHIKVDDDILSYSGTVGDPAGSYSDMHTFDHYGFYFEIEILDTGDQGQISVGVVTEQLSIHANPGPGASNITGSYTADTGVISFMGYDCHTGPTCELGDRMGVGLRIVSEPTRPSSIFFTKNGREIKSVDMMWLQTYLLYPAVGMQSEGEEVLICRGAVFGSDVTQMVVDCGEEDWARLDDVRLNGTYLEYAGRGHAIHDVGLAQAKYPLDTTSHYFEFEIVEPGEGCFVAIGLTKKNYPVRRHPGWNAGSIAYHADDGKLFHGSGLGVRFGPKCSVGDVMGCGIYFPPDYDSEAELGIIDDDDDADFGEEEDGEEGKMDKLLRIYDDSDEELVDALRMFGEQGRPGGQVKGTKVTVFFTRNGKLVGHRDVRIPKGGFYPTVGMLSLNEKVKVDLRPFTG